MEEKKDLKVIDLYDIAKKLWARKKLFAKTLSVAFVLSCVFILGFPRYYDTEIKLAPETDNFTAGSSLSSLASSFGFDINSLQSNDAISPLLYPDLMEDNGFVAGLLNVKVKTLDGKTEATYYDYITKHQKSAIWFMPISWIMNMFKEKDTTGQAEFDPYHLSRTDNDVIAKIRGDIKLSFDKKTSVITLSVTDQDALVCKTIADTVKTRLQQFITAYRTSKARIDYEYYKELAGKAKHEYEKARDIYAASSDASTNVALKSIELKLESMEDDMQLKFNTYSTINTQLQAAKAKVQARTPAFTVIKGAAVPIKPAGPKRMVFVALCLFLTLIGTGIYAYNKSV